MSTFIKFLKHIFRALVITNKNLSNLLNTQINILFFYVIWLDQEFNALILLTISITFYFIFPYYISFIFWLLFLIFRIFLKKRRQLILF